MSSLQDIHENVTKFAIRGLNMKMAKFPHFFDHNSATIDAIASVRMAMDTS
jgi:hypothetical protein